MSLKSLIILNGVKLRVVSRDGHSRLRDTVCLFFFQLQLDITSIIARIFMKTERLTRLYDRFLII